MLRRYVLPCVLIMGISIATAWAAHAGTEKTEFTATCTFNAVIRLSPRPPQTPEEAKLVNSLAGQQVGIAIGNGIYEEVAKSQKVKTSTVARYVRIAPSGIGFGTFAVRITNTVAKKAAALTGALCDAF